jgi:NAD(P)-dependent dehydrogenase (short-subunit alcohol dehydrogenase family)
MGRSSFAGSVAVVTGGASGIGAALAKGLARQGAEVVLADRQLALAEGVASSIKSEGGNAWARELDVRDAKAQADLAAEVWARTGRVDLLFNNAGIGVGGEIHTYADRDWDDVFDVNLRGVAYGIQAFYPRMLRQGSGHIVNTASMAGLVTSTGAGSYAATKHAVVGLSKALRVEAKAHGVRVSALCPGAIATPILTGGKYGRMNLMGLSDAKILEIWAQVRPMDVDVFAEKVLRAVAKNEAIIVVPSWWKAFWYLERLSPELSFRLWGKMLERLRADMAAAGVDTQPAAKTAAAATAGSTAGPSPTEGPPRAAV